MKRINLRGCSFDCLPRILWQALFDFYRENGGSLDNMDNMLIDLRNCEKVFREQNGETEFLFGFRGYQTTWFHSPEYNRNSYMMLTLWNHHEYFLYCRVFDDTIEIEHLDAEAIRESLTKGQK